MVALGLRHVAIIGAVWLVAVLAVGKAMRTPNDDDLAREERQRQAEARRRRQPPR